MHAIIEEICRVRAGETVRPEVLRRWQAALRNDVQPLLDERDTLKAEADAAAPKNRKVTA
jgi:hypothetical protein